MSIDSDCVLVIMAKAPRAGAVKTRLAQNLPPSAVVDLYCCLLDDTLSLAKSLDGVQIAMMCPAADVDELSSLVGEEVRVLAQVGDGLAAGLVSVFDHFTDSGRHRTIALNSDSPHLPVSVLQAGFEALASCDLVLGPTHDGGYYLVGSKTSYAGLFVDRGMGTGSALDELLNRARGLGLSVQFTPPFYDVDVPADLTRLAGELRLAPQKAPRTAAWLKGRPEYRSIGRGAGARDV